MGKPISRP